VGGCRVTGDCP